MKNGKTFNYKKKHDKLKAEPHLSLQVSVLKKEGHSIELFNNGFGPCQLKNIKYTINEKEYVDVNELYVDNFNEMSKFVLPGTSELHLLGPSSNIARGSSIILLRLNFMEGFDERYFIEFLKNVKIIINYTNIYNDGRTHEEHLMGRDAYTGV